VIGRNGAGKSTLLKILARITEPTSGRAVINGRVGSLLEVGTGFHPELTGRENIYLNGAILGMRRQEINRRFDEIVAFSEIEKFLDTPVKRYSSGMYVRLAFAVAAHLEPEILLVDEVLAVGDAAFQKKSLGKMGQVASEGRTVLFVSHNMTAIQQLCSQTILLTAGEAAGPLSTVEAVRKYNGIDTAIAYNSYWSHPPAAQGTNYVASVSLKQYAQPTDQIKMTSPFQIEFHLSPEASKRECLLGIYILNKDRQIIIHAMDVFGRQGDSKFQQVGHRTAQVPAFGLTAGDYWLTYWLANLEEGIWDQSAEVVHWQVIGDSPVMMKLPEREWKGKVGPGLVTWETQT
jgi:lipopolysaccharide transport system ATP-binding protein